MLLKIGAGVVAGSAKGGAAGYVFRARAQTAFLSTTKDQRGKPPAFEDIRADPQRTAAIRTLDFVRTALIEQQREMGKAKGIVMDGRDIGTTVFPDAELKIFVTASAEVRARRRYDELTARGSNPDYQEILANVIERDHLDQTREISPLRKADDALLLDNSNMTIEGQLQWLCEQYKNIAEQ